MNTKVYEQTKTELLQSKNGAAWVAFNELNGMINSKMFAGKYLNKSQSWLSQRLNGSVVKGKPRVLKNDECLLIADVSSNLPPRLTNMPQKSKMQMMIISVLMSNDLIY